ncbi:MAG TPA: hypothetical protein VMR41_00970 [Patescibacteria group bacterium]|nr:hypothetical protein [Patescibacteria group bacterium]
MPRLTRENFDQEFSRIAAQQGNFGKFVRQENIVWWNPAYARHKDIADAAGMNHPDDAGTLAALAERANKQLEVSGESSGFHLPKSEDQRVQTIEVFNALTSGFSTLFLAKKCELGSTSFNKLVSVFDNIILSVASN